MGNLTLNQNVTPNDSYELTRSLENFLVENKAQETCVVDLKDKSHFADYMIITSGSSGRFLCALSEKVKAFLQLQGIPNVRIEGTQTAEWVLVDGGDVIVHLFKPDVREEYKLEEMWQPKLIHNASL